MLTSHMLATYGMRTSLQLPEFLFRIKKTTKTKKLKGKEVQLLTMEVDYAWKKETTGQTFLL